MRVLTFALLGLFILHLPAQQQAVPVSNDAANEQFRIAYGLYQAGQFPAASALLEKLEAAVPKSFELHELLGLTYAAEAEDGRAIEQLRRAATLKPASAAAQNNLATAYMRAAKTTEAEAAWREALALEPADYSATRNLAKLYLQQGKIEAALPLLSAARQLRPTAKDNDYDLALAYVLMKQPDAARPVIENMLSDDRSGEFHRLLGRIDEEQGHYVASANDFAEAARLDPSEENLFAWASELLEHRAYEAAITVFEQGTARYAQSPRLWVGLGMSQYSRGQYKPAVRALLTAADLNAEDPRCYFFLSKAYLSAPSDAEQVIDRFHRYAELKPNDAMAQFYYGMGLWKGRRLNAGEIDYPAVETQLRRSIELDAANAEVHFELGVFYNDEHAPEKSLPELLEAVRLDPNFADAHFRLGRYYLRAGEKDKSQQELDRFKQLQAQHQAAVDKQRADVQQFVIATQPESPIKK